MNYHDITYDDMKNGDGLRVVLWVAGCDHHCTGCQNPITWNPNDGIQFDDKAVQEICCQLDNDYISGITLSGGDPLYKDNRSTVLNLCKVINEFYPNKTIWLYTGYTYEDIKDLEIMNYIDILVDGRYVEKLRDTKLKWRGSSNQRVIDIRKTRETGDIVLWCD